MTHYSKTGVYAYISASAGTTTTIAGDFYRLEGTFTNEVLEGFSIPVDKVTYLGEPDHYKVDLHLTLNSDTNNTVVTVALYKNGVLEANSQMTGKLNQTTDKMNLSLTDVLLLENGDDIEIRIASDQAGAVVTAEKCTASLSPFHGDCR